MRKASTAMLIFALATAIHIDWHFARHTHHRLSLGWPQHWIFAAAAFALTGWTIARFWPTSTARTALVVVAGALFLAQGVEPFSEVLLYQHRIGFPDEPERWSALFASLAAGIPAMMVTLWLCRPNRADRAAPALKPLS
jgi:hypothetical protein